ncbi:c-type cytochrome [Methylophilus sp. VKM B-3414]|uniref:c-type cytochrome n=1 Tax=Methylophilus sp. VKM B-3414 TaxID=3076121 RepID=UPI0028C8EAAA|nr:c-type cytochrome [Methylophilus sp. VKM B-3414]MDT7848141.1 c-type cytochrome [Methylophilus sp. VKM B-3414]
MNIVSFFSISTQLTRLIFLSVIASSALSAEAMQNGLSPLEGPQNKNPYRGNRTAENIGYRLYKAHCALCHGENAVAHGKAPDLRFLPTAEEGDAFYFKSVHEGKNSSNSKISMPAFADKLTQEEIWAIRTWLETIPNGDE